MPSIVKKTCRQPALHKKHQTNILIIKQLEKNTNFIPRIIVKDKV